MYEAMTPEEEAAVAEDRVQVREMFGPNADCYWDWRVLPDRAVLVNFAVLGNGHLRYEGLYDRSGIQAYYPTEEEIEKNIVQPCFKVAELFGYSSEEIGKALNAHRGLLREQWKKRLPRNDNGIFFSITELGRTLREKR